MPGFHLGRLRVAACFAMAISAPAVAQCGPDGHQWFPSGAGVNGVDGPVQAIATWDPDGGGPRESLLVAGGEFRAAGTVRARSLAAWDGLSWTALGGDLGGPADSYVAALTVFEGDLIAGGWFTSAAGTPVQSVARWDGASWQALGMEFWSISSLTVYNGQLVAAGQWTSPWQPRIARWTGAAWEPLGDLDLDVAPVAMLGHDGELIIASPADGVFGWDGVVWRELSGFGVLQPHALTEYNGDLIAVGRRIVARWDGSAWIEIGELQFEQGGWIGATLNLNGDLYIGGRFTDTLSGARNLAVWDSVSWQALGTDAPFEVHALDHFNGKLVFGGVFSTAFGTPAQCIAARDQGGTVPLGNGFDHEILDLESFGTTLVASGAFTSTPHGPAAPFASWDGSRWEPFGDGSLAGRGELITIGPSLYAGGHFEDEMDNQVYVARWDGEHWDPVSDNLLQPATALGAHQGQLVASGRWGVRGSYLVQTWNGTNWTPLGNPMDDRVEALFSFDGDLIAGGLFSRSGSTTTGAVAKWDGESWRPMGNLDGRILSLAVFNGELYAGGHVLDYSTETAYGVVRWDGADWRRVGTEVTRYVAALQVYDGELYAAGLFLLGGLPGQGVARWNGASWRALGGGLFTASNTTPQVHTLAVHDGSLFAGGTFFTADGATSATFARWACPPCPVDLNDDRLVNVFDLLTYLDRWFAGSASADLTGDSTVDTADLLVFVDAWFSGC